MSALRSVTRLALTGAPSLYRAARDAGADRATALRVLGDSALVLVRAARHSPRSWREQNAVRHFTWQAWLTARHGLRLARAVATAQERGREALADSRVDRSNNASGQEYGETHADELVALGRRSAVSRLLAEATRRFRSGELASEPRPPRRRHRRRRSAADGPVSR